MASDASLLRAGVEAGLGLSTAPADVLRYDHQSADPAESTGLLIAGIPTVRGCWMSAAGRGPSLA